MNSKKLTAIITAIFIVFITFSVAISCESYFGTIKGANAVVNSLKSAESSSDPMIAMERDFVFVDDAGNYFFMPEIKRAVKTSCYKKDLRILGEKRGNTLKVQRIDIIKNGRYSCVWDHDEDWREKSSN